LNERKVIYNYTNPEGRRMEAVFYIDFILRPGYLEPASPTFDPLHIPRIVATQEAVRVLSENAASFPAPRSCELSIEVARQNDAERIKEQILQAIQEGHCPDGRYFVAGLSFDTRSKAQVTP
ncbi:MAG: hypothetical protein ACK8QZ_12130, partial [Anaerolineales bacterium]